MNLAIILVCIAAIVFSVLWAWIKLLDKEEGDLISIGLGTYVEYSAFKMRVIIALVVCFVVLLVGLLP